MPLSIGLFTPDLTDHYVRWAALGLSIRARRYNNSVDGVPMFAVMTPNPHTGVLMKMHGLVVDSSIAHLFEDLEDEACSEEFDLGFESSKLHLWWQAAEGNVDDSLPKSIVAKFSHPTSDVDAVRAFMEGALSITTGIWRGHGKSQCAVAEAGIKTYVGTGYISLKFVDNEAAATVNGVNGARARGGCLPSHAYSLNATFVVYHVRCIPRFVVVVYQVRCLCIPRSLYTTVFVYHFRCIPLGSCARSRARPRVQ